MSALALSGPGDVGRGELSRWGASFATVLGLHAAVLAATMVYRSAPIAPGEALPAVMIDMAPSPAAPEAAPSSAPLEEEVREAAVSDADLEAPPDIPEPDVALPEPVLTADVPLPDPVPQVPPMDQVVPPTPVVKETAAVALPPPRRPVSAPAKKVESKPEAKKPPKPVQARRAEPQQGSPRPPQQRSGAQTTAALGSASTGSSAASRAGWQGAIVAALNRAKRPQQNSGTASVRFSVDRGGRVLSASLAGSTGVAGLDQEAVSLVRRANIPAPPGDVPGEAFTFTVPIRFTQH